MAAIDLLYVSLADRASKDAALGGMPEAAATQTEIEGIYNRQVERMSALRERPSQP